MGAEVPGNFPLIHLKVTDANNGPNVGAHLVLLLLLELLLDGVVGPSAPALVDREQGRGSHSGNVAVVQVRLVVWTPQLIS